MKTIVSKLSAFAIGAIVMAGAHAGPVTVTSITYHASQTGMVADKNFGRTVANTLQSYDVSTSDGASFLALCIDPATAFRMNKTSTYSVDAFSGFAADKQVQRLFSAYYGAAQTSTSKSLSFQVALWELYNDTGDTLLGTTGNLGAFSYSLSKNTAAERTTILNDANAMLSYALTEAAITQEYNYTLFKSDSSQWLVGASPVAAVPEPSTFAMMGLGLGLMGFIARRRKQG